LRSGLAYRVIKMFINHAFEFGGVLATIPICAYASAFHAAKKFKSEEKWLVC
jgi:hypothetical protein